MGSGHDLTVGEFKPCVRLCVGSSQPGACFRFCVSLSFSAHLSLTLYMSLSKINIKKTRVSHTSKLTNKLLKLKLVSLKVYLFCVCMRERERERERESTHEQGRAERERENPKQAWCYQCRALAGGSIPQNCEIMTLAKIKSRRLNHLSHPGSPKLLLLFFNIDTDSERANKIPEKFLMNIHARSLISKHKKGGEITIKFQYTKIWLYTLCIIQVMFMILGFCSNLISCFLAKICIYNNSCALEM